MGSGDSRHLSELRIVLLGGRYEGKSSSGNTILGREEFDLRTAAQCVKRQGEVAGRQVTVVDTPGWARNLSVERTTELVKQEIVHSVFLCPPGPHTLLLVIDLSDSFREQHRRAVEGHLQLLSEIVWSHTIVLFTRGDRLGDTTIEQHIETEGKVLQWLVEKCGNRYHVLNNKNRGDDTQVTELLDKVEHMVAGNRGGHYEMDREILEKMEERRRAEEERAQQRLMKVQEQRESLRSLMGDSLHLSELRIVLLGGRGEGKSSSGNTILGREEFDLRTAAQCVKRQGEVAGRQVTVVDTPGWWGNLPVVRTTELVKQEIVRSVSLCPPGPHTLLLVIELSDSFREEHRRAVEGHLQLLSEIVWSHTIVLFTRGDRLGDTTIEQHIETEGKALQWLVEKCGNRYHVLNNKNRGDDTQVTELLDKVEEMVAGNRGGHYEMDREILEKMEERRRAEEERAQQRLMKVQEQRESLRSLMGDSLHLSELRIVLLGGRGAGKSSSGNTILGREEFDLRTAAQCVKRQGEVAGRQVTVVDTPGWRRCLCVERTTELVKQEIVRSVSLCPPGPHTLLLVIDLDDSFREEHRISVEGHLQLLSERVWSHTIVLFTRGDRLGDTTIEQHIETEGKALQWLVEKCGNRYHVLNNKNRGDDTQVTELLDKVEHMVAGNRGGHYEMDREILEKMEERRRAEEERAQQRLMKVQEQRESLRGDSLHLSELRIVLLGGRYEGKSSSGNTILGREEFDLRTAAQCVKRQGEVAGRQVTVVDTPGWRRCLCVERTTELVKQEIVHSVSLCPPGPHTLLLVIDLSDSFREEHRRSVEENLQLLSERVWSHTIVLFTRGDRLGDTTIEQHIETEGKVLQWLVVKCGNRYHVLNNKNRGDDTQVTELLDKVEEMVAGNRGGHYEMDRKILKKVEVWRKSKEMRAKQRAAKVMEQREIHRTFISDSLHLSELRIVLLGGRGEGKSSSGNTILGREEFDLRKTAQCVKRQGEVAGRQVTVVDTPGWWRYFPVEDTTNLVKQEIVHSVSLCPPGPHTILLVINLSDSFREEEASSIEGHLQLLSERVWSHTIVLFTCGDRLGDTTIEQHIETEGKVLQWLVEKCGNRYHVLNNENRGDDTQVTELLDKVEEMVAANSGDVFHPQMDVSKEINWSSEEYQMSPLPVTKVRSIDFPPNMSGDSRAETDCDSGWKSEARSEAGSLLRSEQWGGGRSDVLSLRSSGYGSQTSRPSGSAEEQLRCARLAFVERVSKPVLDYLLDGLLQERVINNAEREAVKVETQRAERAEATIDMVLRKGDDSCSVMRCLLCDMDPYLYSKLGFK
ncbi:uncharacterized protein [Osmerus mordax]|uniref:uncharacterized protein n=1 Tax=Osmerus mordax TaxID=8014 RepID=UPI00350EE7DC